MDTLHVQVLWQVMEKLRDANQLEDALSRCLDLFCTGTQSPKGSIWMLDDQSGRTIAINAYGTSDAAGESAGKGEGLVGRVVESGETELHRASDVQNMKLAGVDSPALNDKNMMCVPGISFKRVDPDDCPGACSGCCFRRIADTNCHKDRAAA